jgi:hypothetical protein
MFENMFKNTEDKKQNCEMPCRKFYKNTFGELINGGMFLLQKKQAKEPQNGKIFTVEGQV